MDLHEIGSFQFENLVRNRVPFVLMNLGADLSNLFPSFYQSYMETQVLPTTSENALQDLRLKAPNHETAVIVVCDDGRESAAVAARLREAGYGNAFALSDGTASLRENR